MPADAVKITRNSTIRTALEGVSVSSCDASGASVVVVMAVVVVSAAATAVGSTGSMPMHKSRQQSHGRILRFIQSLLSV
jgi:hypothetical protein